MGPARPGKAVRLNELKWAYLTHLARCLEAEWERGLALTMDQAPTPGTGTGEAGDSQTFRKNRELLSSCPGTCWAGICVQPVGPANSHPQPQLLSTAIRWEAVAVTGQWRFLESISHTEDSPFLCSWPKSLP